MSKKKYYSVRVGKAPGVYESWPEAEAMVKGFPGAKYKGFATKDEALKWLSGEAEPTPGGQRKKEKNADIPALRQGEIAIYTDGGAINNPGPGGYGVVIVRPEGEMELSAGFRLTTNNRMELTACIEALTEVKGSKEKMILFSDSSYVVNGIAKGWAHKWERNGWVKSDRKPVLNRDLWEKLLRLVEIIDVTFKWVKGHAGNPLNERCDKLAVKSARSGVHRIDTEYESGL